MRHQGNLSSQIHCLFWRVAEWQHSLLLREASDAARCTPPAAGRHSVWLNSCESQSKVRKTLQCCYGRSHGAVIFNIFRSAGIRQSPWICFAASFGQIRFGIPLCLRCYLRLARTEAQQFRVVIRAIELNIKGTCLFSCQTPFLQSIFGGVRRPIGGCTCPAFLLCVRLSRRL